MSVTERVLQVVRMTIMRHRMLEPGDLVVCAVSGGPDSMCLLDVMCLLREEFGIRLHVGHLNHKMRPEASTDAEMVAEFATSRGIPVTVGEQDVLALGKELGVGVEEAGRIARYRFLSELKERLSAQKVAVGHNMNDQAETVLMRLVGGAGLRGLCGIPPVMGHVIRPLIEVPRADTEEYCRLRNLPTIMDVYNLDLTYKRNLVRHEIMPKLAASMNPSVVRTLSDVSLSLRWDAEYIEKQADTAFARHSRLEGVVTSIGGCQLRDMPRAIASRVVERAWRQSGGKGNLNVSLVREVLEGQGSVVTLPDGVRMQRTATGVDFYPPVPSGFLAEINVPGETILPELGITIVAKAVDVSDARVGEPVRHLRFYPEPRACVDFAKSVEAGKIRVRTRRPGDKFKPLGMGGKEKKLQDFFVSSHVPRLFRDFVPIITCGEEIMWVGGWRLAENFKVDDSTASVLRLEIAPRLRAAAECASMGESNLT